MASSGYITTNEMEGRSLTLSWYITSQSVDGNYSDIAWTLYGSGGYTGYVMAGDFYATINGEVVCNNSNRIQLRQNTVVASGTQRIYHGSDGSKTFYLYCQSSIYTFAVSATAEGYHTLNNIPRASTVSATSTDMGSASTISINSASSNFTHTLTYSFGNASGTIITGTTSSIIYWTPSAALASQMPNTTSGYCTIYCYTYNGSTYIGVSSCTIVLSIPASVKPTIESLSATRIDGDVPSAWGIYVQTKSKATLTINNAAGAYGSSIRAYSISGGGYSSSASSLTTGFLNTAGQISFTGRVMDSRGRWSDTKTITISVTEYAPPVFDAYSAIRCTSTGQTAASGTYAKCNVAFSYSSCGGKNAVATAVAYKKSIETEYTPTSISFSSGVNFVFGGSFNVDYTYDIRYTVTDAFGAIAVADHLPTASVLMDFKTGGLGMAIGKVCEQDKFECGWDADFGGKLRVNNLDDIMIGDRPLSEFIGGGGIEKAYPIGSLYISTIATDPYEILGFGRWERIQDRFLLAGGSSYLPGSTGGEASHALTLSEIPSHTHGLNAHTHDAGSLTAAASSHNHTAALSHAACNYFRGYMMRDTGSTSYSGEYAAAGSSSAKGFSMDTDMSISVGYSSHSHTLSGSTGGAAGNTAYSGGSTAHNNMPPYLAVYVWKRVPESQPPSYTVYNISGASYGFAMNSDGYYESQNKGQDNTYAICQVNFNCQGKTMYLDCINYAESSFDFGMIGVVDGSLSLSINVDSNLLHNFSGQQSASVQTVEVGCYEGDHFIQLKYRKDSSVSSNNDSLQFKVRFSD